MISIYIFAYYTIAALSVFLSPFVRWEPKFKSRPSGILLRYLIIFLISTVYLIGMIRQQGIDYGIYLNAFYEDPSLIPDAGFRVLMSSFNAMGFRFEVMMMSIGLFTLYSLKRTAKKFNVSFTLLLIIYFLHLAVIRDFSQLRVGLAMSTACFAITLPGRLGQLTTYFIASSIHLTSFLFIIFYEYGAWLCCLKKSTSQKLFALLSWAMIVIFSSSIQILAFLDERVNIYLNWHEEGYGVPATQFSSLLLHFGILVIAVTAFLTKKRWLKHSQIKLLLYMQATGLIIFLSLSNYAAFAFRLSSVVLSLYPVLLVLSLKQGAGKESHLNSIIRRLIYIVIAFLLMSRSGNLDILRAIEFDLILPI